MHTTAFIVTSLLMPPDGAEPDEQTLYRAAYQAAQLAAAASPTAEPAVQFESFAIGCRRDRFIQGQPWPPWTRELDNQPNVEGMTHQLISQRRPEAPDEAAIRMVPSEVLRRCWNSAGALVGLALQNPTPEHRRRPDGGLIYPDVLIGLDGRIDHAVGYPDVDVFNHRAGHEDAAKTGAVRYLPDHDPGSAHHLACAPLRTIERARFNARYIRHLATWPDSLVIEADWNL